MDRIFENFYINANIEDSKIEDLLWMSKKPQT